jgi:hypothetical protein
MGYGRSARRRVFVTHEVSVTYTNRGECTPDQTGMPDAGDEFRPALAAFAEELSQPVLQIPFLDELTQQVALVSGA